MAFTAKLIPHLVENDKKELDKRERFPYNNFRETSAERMVPRLFLGKEI